MKIATWNLERPRPSSRKNDKIFNELKKQNADILILTETNSVINLSENYKSLASEALPSPGDFNYTQGENRTTIWSKISLGPTTKTYDPFSSVCTSILLSGEKLNVYGTVIGAHGNRHNSFMNDLEKQIDDWDRICTLGAICIAGDFNLSFHDGYYYTKAGRTLICDFFKQREITILTCGLKDNIDHIAISNSFLERAKYTVNREWNAEKKLLKPRLSDHIGVSVSIEL